MSTNDEARVKDLYFELLTAWNNRRAAAFAALFAEDGSVVGFDGSQVDSRAEIEGHLRPIFADHPTGAYIGIVREVRFLNRDAALVRSVAGVVPAGKADINPDQNSIQSLVATRQDGTWRIALYHNTPAQFHGRPELAESLSHELRQVLKRTQR